MKIWRDGHAKGVTPPKHFGGLKVIDVVPFEGRNFSVQVSKAPPGGGGELHHHDSWSQVFFVVNGEMTFDTGKDRFTLKAGESVLFDPRDPHHTINESDTDSLCLVITVARGT